MPFMNNVHTCGKKRAVTRGDKLPIASSTMPAC